LTVEQLSRPFEAAIQRRAGAGMFSDDAFRHLRQLTWQVADLGGDLLAQLVGDTVTLDDDAAGYGWFVDPTPFQDEEFTPTAVANVLTAVPGGPAVDRMDLVTAMLHAMGQELGLKDLDPAAPEGPMTALLGTGKRRVP
jgi:hypothetical protein